MKDLVLKNLLQPSQGAELGGQLPEFLRTKFGFRQFLRQGNDLVISKDDMALRRGPPRVLEIKPEICFEGVDHSGVADQMAAAVPTDFDHLPVEVPKDVSLDTRFGLVSEFYELSIEVAFAAPNDLPKLLADKLLPFMAENFKATHVTSVVMDVNEQQTRVSFTKLALLVNRHGIDDARLFVEENRTLSQIAPHPLAAVGYPSAFTFLPPTVITLPVARRGCVWHFYRHRNWFFPFEATSSLANLLASFLSPLSDEANEFPMRQLGQFSIADIWSYLRFVVRAADVFLRFLNNPLSFQCDSGEADPLRQFQAMSAANLLFSDLISLCAVREPHSRITSSFLVIDKLANLRRALGEQTDSEPELAKKMISISQLREIRRAFQSHGQLARPQIPRVLRQAARESFLSIQRQLQSGSEMTSSSELERLNRFRSFRNLKHGAFLGKNQFESLFLDSHGSMPPGIVSVPFLLTLALCLDPERFLSFKPSVS